MEQHGRVTPLCTHALPRMRHVSPAEGYGFRAVFASVATLEVRIILQRYMGVAMLTKSTLPCVDATG